MLDGGPFGARRALLAGLAAGILAVAILLSTLGHASTLRLWNIRTYGWTFLDVRLIPGAAESYAQGYDPAFWNPGDPLHRQFNYPRIWYLFFRLPMTQAWAVPMGLASLVLFLAGLWAFPGSLTKFSAALLLLAVFSPAGMLAMSRANTDILVFAAMALSLILVEKHATAAMMVLLGGIVFKIIPVLGAGLFLTNDDRSSLRRVIIAILSTGLYFVLTLKDMLFIFGHTQKGYEESYGLAVLPGLVRTLAHDRMVRAGPAIFSGLVHSLDGLFMTVPVLPYAAAGVLLVLFTYLGANSRISSENSSLRDLRALWMGAGMYVGTFWIGNNWDYRLVFLFFAIPQLANWATQGTATIRRMSTLALILMFGSLWGFLIRAWMAHEFSLGAAYANVLDEALNWALYATLVFLIAASIPSWLFDGIRFMRARLRPAASIVRP